MASSRASVRDFIAVIFILLEIFFEIDFSKIIHFEWMKWK